MRSLTLYADNTSTLTAEGLRDPGGQIVTGADATGTLTPEAGGAAVWTGTLAETATPGTYAADLAASLGLAVGDRLFLDLTVDASGRILKERALVTVRAR